MENRALEIRSELRFLADGYLELKGSIPYMSKSSSIFDKKKRAFFTEQIMNGAFSTYFQNASQMPKLLINHDWGKQLDVVKFDFEEDSGEFEFTYIFLPNDEILANIDSITSFSFGFTTTESLEEWTKIDNSNWERLIKGFVSVSEFSLLIGLEPCYESTSVKFKGNNIKKAHKVETNVGQYKNQIDQLKNSQSMQHYKNILQEMKKKSAPVYSVEDARQYIKSKKKC